MSDVADLCGLHASRNGFVKCPFHDDRTASLKLYDHTYHCFGCGAGGDSIDFVARFYGISQKEALRKVNESLRLGLPLDKESTVLECRQLSSAITTAEIENQLDKDIQQILESVCDFWANLYAWADKQSMDYQPDSPVWVRAIKDKELFAEEWRVWEGMVVDFERSKR